LGGQRGRIISIDDRNQAILLIEEAIENGARQIKACEILEISEMTFKRWRDLPIGDQRLYAKKKEPANKLSKEERAEIIKLATSEKYKSTPPCQIVPALADEGCYIASESTFYRVLNENKLQKHRGKAKQPVKRAISTHKATGPNQVWMWDITWLPGPIKGLYYYLYLIIDLYSRKVVGWEIWEEESSAYASKLITKATYSESINTKMKPLVLHSDNGSPMKGSTMLATLYHLGIEPSRSRPRVSNDNPYAEAIFRTVKYTPRFPSNGFNNLKKSREWVKGFVEFYNYKHKHSGLNFITPFQRHVGLDKKIFTNRKEVYEKARVKHPERWTQQTRNWSLEREVWLNPEKTSDQVVKERIG